MWEREDSQEVGSEAAILERVRNSSLVEWSCAENVTGLKPKAEAADLHSARGRCHLWHPPRELRVQVVGERRAQQ